MKKFVHLSLCSLTALLAAGVECAAPDQTTAGDMLTIDRKSTRLNSSH